MALLVQYLNDTGVMFSEAYHRIVKITVAPSEKKLYVDMATYKNQQYRNEGKIFVIRNFLIEGDRFDLYFSESIIKNESKTHIVKAYEAIKAEIGEYSGAIDV